MTRTKLALSLGAETTAEALSILEEVGPSLDIVELRLDFMREYDLRRLLHDRPCPSSSRTGPCGKAGGTRAVKPLECAPCSSHQVRRGPY